MMFGQYRTMRTLSLCMILALNMARGEDACRHRSGYDHPSLFASRGCTDCYFFLFHYKTDKLVAAGQNHSGLARKLKGNVTILPDDIIYPNVELPETIDKVCETLSDYECGRWVSCCKDATACCKAQLLHSDETANATYSQCPSVWDGYACWSASLPGDVFKECPSFLLHSSSSRMATKRCEKNGSWYKNQQYEWTDYTNCVDKSRNLTEAYISLACNVLSIIFTIPAILIFLIFRELRKEKRVKIHIQLLLALALCAIVSCLWYSLVHMNTATAATGDTMVINMNPVWCRVLSIVKLYLTCASYVWLLCEGIYLHTLLAHAYRHPVSLVLLHVVGWGIPFLLALVYSIVRGILFNETCWAKNAGYWEWIFYAPNMICLILNLAFLVNILRILLFQLHAHPHEPSNFRRGVKAAFMLIPLFGLHLLLTMYRPSPDLSTATNVYEYIGFVVSNSQGIFVAVIFCYCNKEVIANIRRVCKCLPAPKRKGGYETSGMSTQYTVANDTIAQDHDEHNHPGSRKELHANLKNMSNNKPGGHIEMVALEGVDGNANKGSKTGGGNDDRGKYHMVPVITEGSEKSSSAVHL